MGNVRGSGTRKACAPPVPDIVKRLLCSAGIGGAWICGARVGCTRVSGAGVRCTWIGCTWVCCTRVGGARVRCTWVGGAGVRSTWVGGAGVGCTRVSGTGVRCTRIGFARMCRALCNRRSSDTGCSHCQATSNHQHTSEVLGIGHYNIPFRDVIQNYTWGDAKIGPPSSGGPITNFIGRSFCLRGCLSRPHAPSH